MKKITSIIATIIFICIFTTIMTVSISAAELDIPQASETTIQNTEAGENSVLSTKAIAASVVVAVVGAAGAIGMSIAISKSTESMARQPEAAGKINSAMMLGIVFIETAIIYALIVAILIIFVL